MSAGTRAAAGESGRATRRSPRCWRASASRARFDAPAVELPGNAGLTLNGVAQGYITDRTSALLREAGFRHVLVDLGKSRALDARADGGAWRVGLMDGTRVSLSNGALATSSGAATRFADNGDRHIFDPTTGRLALAWRWLSVAHPLAVVADAPSTGLYCLEPKAALRALQAIPGARFWAQTADGRRIASPA